MINCGGGRQENMETEKKQYNFTYIITSYIIIMKKKTWRNTVERKQVVNNYI